MGKAKIKFSGILKLVPALLALVGDVADALEDGQLSDDELKALGAKIVALVVDAIE